jgi:transposase
VPVSPNAIKAWRDGEVLSGAKSDAGDAVVIAEYLRLRCHRLRPATPFTAQTKALRTVVRTRDDVVQMRVTATNQLAALLDAHWPGAKAIFADVESPIALAFLTRYPTAAHAAHLGEKRLHSFCVKHGYSGRRTAAELLARLRQAPAGDTEDGLVDAVGDAVLALVAVLKALGGARKDLNRSVAARLGEHPDTKIFTSLPRSGQINAAQMLAEWGDCREAYDGPDSVAALAGVPPVTKASGKYHAVHFRWACNKRFRAAVTTFADNSRHKAPGPPTYTPLHWPAATTTPTASGYSPGHGSASFTDAGSTAPPTTPACTAAPAGSPPRRPEWARRVTTAVTIPSSAAPSAAPPPPDRAAVATVLTPAGRRPGDDATKPFPSRSTCRPADPAGTPPSTNAASATPATSANSGVRTAPGPANGSDQAASAPAANCSPSTN